MPYVQSKSFRSSCCCLQFGLRYLKFLLRTSMNKQLVMTLIVGIIVGFSLALLVLPRSLFTSPFDDPHTSAEMEHIKGPESDPGEHDKNEEFHKLEDRIVADEMARRVRILCWVMTRPHNHARKARHVKNTWGKRCNILLFMSSHADKSLPAIALPVGEGRHNLWAKTKEAFKYVYTHHLDEADWFLKADDDTYVILENLRYMLLPHKPSEPVYYGCKFKPFVNQGYMSGGAGYVLSREAVRRFVEIGLQNSTICSSDNRGAEDIEMGICMEGVNVLAGDSRDSIGRGRFFPFVPEHHLIPGHSPKNFWFFNYTFYESKEGMDCCSDNAVSFHYISPSRMYMMEYLIYHLHPYGITYKMKLPGEEDDVRITANESDMEVRDLK